MQPNLFDIDQGRADRDEGKALAARPNWQFLEIMRRHATSLLAEGHPIVTADDCRRHAQYLGIRPTSSAAWGSIFAPLKFEATGHVQSTFKANHARWICTWRLRRGK